ncbi:MAG: nucleotide disphospho-sugar-binding domain-containing protein, partial [Pseudonocardiaceae bacterium]
LPQLILPQGADQFMNAAAGQNARVALALTSDELSAEAVAAAAGRLITEPGFEAAAAHIRAEIGAMPTAADVLASDLLGARRDNHVPA